MLFPSLPAFPSAPGQTSLASSGETLFPTASSPVTSPNSIPPSLEETQNIIVLVVKYPPANAGDIRDAGSIPGSRRFPGGCNGNPPQYSCLKNPMDRGAWWATLHVHRLLLAGGRLPGDLLRAHLLCPQLLCGLYLTSQGLNLSLLP